MFCSSLDPPSAWLIPPSQCVLALSSSIGLTILPTVISLSRTLARLAIGLDKRPDLIASLTQRRENTGDDEAEERVTLVESSANVIREAFKKCLSERSASASGVDPSGRPEGRRVGIYLTANLCLKLFFHCKKLRSAEQIFGNIYQQSPPLSLFPASQRVTFLYYLGRYHFANGHYFRAQLALQSAYNQCHQQRLSQRKLILIYLIAANVILGRFPTDSLWQRPEAAGLQQKFGPLCNAIVKGDLCSFRQYLDIRNESAEWFLHKRILLQLCDNCEVLVWRSLARRTFMLSGSGGDAASRKAPTVALEHLLTLASYLETEALLPSKKKGLSNGNPTVMINGCDPELPNGYTDPDLQGVVDPEPPVLPSMDIIESIVASLIGQDLLHGFITHSNPRFAITGARNAPPLQIGFPKVWDVIKAKSDDEVPGWVVERNDAATGLGGGFRPGMVVNLSGARPAGAAPG